ncbi:LamG domain-containing protein [Candidatus Pacearchaeota archaeon]|nr:LamG domain-containing protein [Candidatus Pacearchaeota archaeon]
MPISSVKFNWNGTNYTMYNDSLVLMMNFDDYTRFNDTSRYGNNGTCTNCPTFNVTGKYGGAYEFDGVAKYFNITDSAVFDLEGEEGLTIAMWLKTNHSAADKYVFSNYNGNDPLYALFVDNGAIRFTIRSTDGLGSSTITGANIANGIWHYIVASRDAGTNTVQIYIDGVTSVQGSDGTAGKTIYPSGALYVGAQYSGVSVGNFFNGTIDELRVYNRTFSLAEVVENYFMNLAKYNATNWGLYVNQSKNSTGGLDYGNYTYFACAGDSNVENCTEQRTVRLSADSVNPLVTIINPTNKTYNLVNFPLLFNVTINENASAMYSLDGGVHNVSMTGNESLSAGGLFGTRFNATNGSLADGSYTFKVYANDTSNNRNYTESIVFSVDRTSPLINFTVPTPINNTITTNNSFIVNVSVVKSNLHNITYSWNGTLINIDVNQVGTPVYFGENGVIINSQAEFSFGTQGENNWYYYRRSLSTGAYSLLQWTDPTWGGSADGILGQTYSHPAPNYDAARAWNVSIPGNIIINVSIRDGDNGVGDGINYSIYKNSEQLYFNSFLNGFSANITNTTSVNVGDVIYFWTDKKVETDYDATLENITIKYGSSYLNLTQLNSTNWGLLVYHNNVSVGRYIYSACASDTSNNENCTETRTIQIVADLNAPLVTIINPTNKTYNFVDFPLVFNVTLNENGSVLYTLDNYLHNYTMTGNESTLFGTAFNRTNSSMSDGSYVFKVWANDTSNNVNNTANITFSVDKTFPEVTINSPTATTYTVNTYLINLTLDESGSCLYSLDYGVNNETLTNNGNIDFNSTKTGIANADYTLTAYCNDSAGNRNYTTNVSFSVSVSSGGGDDGDDGGGGSPGGPTCISEYECGEWSSCSNDQRTRICIDTKCNSKDIIETTSCNVDICVSDWLCGEWSACANGKTTRRCEDLNSCTTNVQPVEELACSIDNCVPDIQCGSWGTCEYEDRIEDVFDGEIKLSGERARECEDFGGCIEGYSDNLLCESSYEIELIEENVCGQKTLIAINKKTGVPVTHINLDAWKNSNLQIKFVQSNLTTCSTCFNNIKDGNENGIDCGGDCAICKDDRIDISYIKWILWLLLLILLLAIGIYLEEKHRKRKRKMKK